MAKRYRRTGRVTVSPGGAGKAVMRGMGIVHAVMGAVFAVVGLSLIVEIGLFGLPFLAGGVFFLVNGLRIALAKEGTSHTVEYDVENTTGEVTEPVERREEGQSTAAAYSLDAQARLEQLQRLKEAGLITEGEYRQKRREILDEL